MHRSGTLGHMRKLESFVTELGICGVSVIPVYLLLEMMEIWEKVPITGKQWNIFPGS